VANNEGHHLSSGLIVGEFWREMLQRYARKELDDFIAVLSHVHGIMILSDKTEDNLRSDIQLNVPT